jgi:hypothetical protein
MELELMCIGVDWIHLNHGIVEWRTIVKTVNVPTVFMKGKETLDWLDEFVASQEGPYSMELVFAA